MGENIWINLSQAIATLVAVVLAFLLSIFTDRSSWKHRKKEQIREHQIDALKRIVILMQDIDSKLKYVIEYKKGIDKEIANSISPAVKQNATENGNKTIEQKMLELQMISGKIHQEYLELRLLRYRKNELQIISDYTNSLDRFICSIQSIDSPIQSSEISSEKIVSIVKRFNTYIEEAENGLTR